MRKRIIPQPLVFSKWICPTSGPLVGLPPARFDEADWYLIEDPSQKETAEQTIDTTFDHSPIPAPLSETSHYKRSVQYLEMVLNTQTPKERQEYESILRQIAACNARPPFQKYGSKGSWLSTLKDDDWWHFRRLLQMLVERYSLERSVGQILEQRLMIVLGAMEGRFTEAVLWLIPLEGLLKELSQYVRKLNKTTSPLLETELAIQQELLRDL